METSPLHERYAPDPSDEHLVARGTAGQADALELLVRRHQRWIYNLAVRVLQSPQDAEDATQEALVKILTRLSTFRGEAAFRTWAYRLALRHILERKRSRPEDAVHGFACLGDYLARAQPDDGPTTPETRALVEEAKLSCLLGMLLCLDREQRLVFVLGEIFEVTDVVGSAVLDIGRDAFRQKLARARQQLTSFMRDQCGLVDPRNPCRCAAKTRAFVRDGIVDPRRLVFHAPHVARVRDVCGERRPQLDALIDVAQARLYRDQPFYDVPDMVARVRALLSAAPWQRTLEVSPHDPSTECPQ